MQRQPHQTREQVLEQLEKDVWLADFDTETFTVLSVPNGLQRHDLPRRSERAKPSEKSRLGAGRVLLRCLICLVTAVLLATTLAAGAVGVVCLGPSDAARIGLVRYTANRPLLSFIPGLFFSQSQINDMLAQDAPPLSQPPAALPPEQPAAQVVSVEDIGGVGFVGTLLSVRDAALIRVSAIDSFSTAKEGATLAELGEGCLAAVSGGRFYDPNGKGKGGMPTGVVIQNGQLLRAASTVTVAGFDGQGLLSVERQSGKQAVKAGILHGVAAEAALIVGGQVQSIKDDTVAARTAVAQLADGTVLFLYIGGGTPGSVGATVQQVQQLLVQRGAVTAALLNSGGSCAMMYDGQPVCSHTSARPRLIPTAFVIGGAV